MTWYGHNMHHLDMEGFFVSKAMGWSYGWESIDISNRRSGTFLVALPWLEKQKNRKFRKKISLFLYVAINSNSNPILFVLHPQYMMKLNLVLIKNSLWSIGLRNLLRDWRFHLSVIISLILDIKRTPPNPNDCEQEHLSIHKLRFWEQGNAPIDILLRPKRFCINTDLRSAVWTINKILCVLHIIRPHNR